VLLTVEELSNDFKLISADFFCFRLEEFLVIKRAFLLGNNREGNQFATYETDNREILFP
jgi:hypothetical protein